MWQFLYFFALAGSGTKANAAATAMATSLDDDI
jgi:hypothetical protein